MFTLDNWHQLRGLALLAVLGLFIMYFVLTGLWLNFRARQRSRPQSAPDQPDASAVDLSNGIERRSAEAQPGQYLSSPDTNQARHAA